MGENLSQIPAEITAGNSYAWTVAGADYPATSGWSLSHVLINGATKYAFSSAASGVNHLTTLNKAATLAFSPGKYKFVTFAESASERVTLSEMAVEVKPDPATTAALDYRTVAQRTLEAIEATLEGTANKGQRRIKIESGGISKEIERCTIPELLQMRDYFRREIARELRRERQKNGMGGGGKVLMRLT